MARPARKPHNRAAGDDQGESVAGYFRKVFKENPGLLKSKSNDELFRRWLQDHPGHSEVPKQVKNSLFNIKSVLRKQRRRRKAAARPEEQSAVLAAAPEKPKTARRALEALEEQIDQCLLAARALDPEGLASVISQLRRARNEVVWKIGE
jgi:hypothetical protein